MEMSLFHFSNVNLQQDPKLQLRQEYKKYFLVFSAIKKFKKKTEHISNIIHDV